MTDDKKQPAPEPKKPEPKMDRAPQPPGIDPKAPPPKPTGIGPRKLALLAQARAQGAGRTEVDRILSL